MPAKSIAQQKFMALVKNIQKGGKGTGKAAKAADEMNPSDVDDFASTKHDGLPYKVKREQRVRSLIKKLVREIMKEDFAGAYPKHMRKKFDKGRQKQSEVLGYKLTGTPDVKTEIDDATVKEACQKGYMTHPTRKTKEMFGKRYRNCVKKEGKLTESQRVAKTILKQLGGNRFIAMTGAKNFGSSRNSLQFKIGRNSKSISHVIITLKSSDLYDVEFIRMRGVNRKVVKKLKGIYADQLGIMFKKYTGMNVRL